MLIFFVILTVLGNRFSTSKWTAQHFSFPTNQCSSNSNIFMMEKGFFDWLSNVKHSVDICILCNICLTNSLVKMLVEYCNWSHSWKKKIDFKKIFTKEFVKFLAVSLSCDSPIHIEMWTNSFQTEINTLLISIHYYLIRLVPKSQQICCLNKIQKTNGQQNRYDTFIYMSLNRPKWQILHNFAIREHNKCEIVA